MTKDEIIARAKKFQGANREFSQELPPIIEAILDNAGPEVVDNLSSNSRTKALSANMGKELKLLVDGKVATPATAGTAGQVLSVDENGVPVWVDAAAGGAYDGEMSDESTNAVQNKVVKKAIEDAAEVKANIDGYYPQLVSGLAENLVDTKGTGSEQEFTDRTSCGDESIADDGTGVIKELRGNSLAWNQLISNGDFSQGTTGWSGRESTTFSAASGVLTITATSAAFTQVRQSGLSIIAGHKYYIHFKSANTNAGGFRADLGVSPWSTQQEIYLNSAASALSSHGVVLTALDNYDRIIFAMRSVESEEIGVATASIADVVVIDLTLMFGAGKEPSTVAEFEALYNELYYPNNNGEIINNAADTLVTDGFNQWDEEWELGYYLANTGQFKERDNGICTKRGHSIPVSPNTNYCIKVPADGVVILFYEINGSYISYVQPTISSGKATFTTPSNAAFINFYVSTAYGTTYNHDICVNLSWSGYRDGEYEPYWKRETGVDMRKLYGKLNGAGDMVQVFPAGGRSAGSVFDVADLVRKEADVRVGSVDLGTLDWAKSISVQCFYAEINTSTDKGSGSINMLCENFTSESVASNTMSGLNNNPDKIRQVGKNICIYSSEYNSSEAATFKAAMNGVMLNYELETPLHYTDLMYSEDGGETFVDIPSVYKVADFGTERIRPLVDAQGNPVTAPFRAVIQYNDDFARELVNLPKNYDTTDSIDDLLSELASALGTALGGTLTITRGAYNAATKKYAWTVSFAASDSPAENTD